MRCDTTTQTRCWHDHVLLLGLRSNWLDVACPHVLLSLHQDSTDVAGAAIRFCGGWSVPWAAGPPLRSVSAALTVPGTAESEAGWSCCSTTAVLTDAVPLLRCAGAGAGTGAAHAR